MKRTFRLRSGKRKKKSKPKPIDPLAAERPPGTARARMFFDEFPRFYETSETAAGRGRLNLRYEAIFAENRDIFAGARVLDIGSHDGRWSVAALKTGAAEVVGIEARDELVQLAGENLKRYAGNDARYRFIAGDVFEILGREPLEVDLVLCLGYLYHTLRYNELVHGIRSLHPRHVIVDSKVVRRKKAVVRLRRDLNDRQRNAVADTYSYGDATLVGWPSARAVEILMKAYGFELERVSDWGSLLRDNPQLHGVEDYATRKRVTARYVSTD
ncbi:MAG: class I SAM-dependent methyltransferase [Gaiellaceae bacterium]